MSLQTMTIEVESNAAAVLQALLEKAKAQGTSLEAMLKPLIQNEAETPAAAAPRNEGMLAVIERNSERLKNTPFSGSTEDSLKVLDLVEENDEGLDVFSLRRMPPEDSFVVQVQFVEAGEGEPRRYDFSGIFADDEEAEAA